MSVVTKIVGVLRSLFGLRPGSTAGTSVLTNPAVETTLRVQGASGATGGTIILGPSTAAAGTDAINALVVGNGTAPTTFPADLSQAWSADVSAGNAALHVRGEGTWGLVSGGGVIVRQAGGVAGTDEIQISHDGSTGLINCKDGPLGARFAGNDFYVQRGSDSTNVFSVTSNFVTNVCGAAPVAFDGGTPGAFTLTFSDSWHVRWTNAANLNTPDTGLKRSAAGILALTDGSTGGGAFEFTELGADPDAPAASKARLYCTDTGGGKTQLCVRFASGAVQVLATEP